VNKRENLLLNKNFQSFPKLVIFPIIPIFQIGIGEGTCHPPPIIVVGLLLIFTG
jgi:hypothetical protein